MPIGLDEYFTQKCQLSLEHFMSSSWINWRLQYDSFENEHEDKQLEMLNVFLKPQDPNASIDGFVVYNGELTNGKSPFVRMPESHRRYLQANEEDLLLAEHELKDQKEALAQAPKKFVDFGKKVTELADEANAEREQDRSVYQSPFFQILAAELENFEKLGSEPVKLTGNIRSLEDGAETENAVVTPQIANTMFDRLQKAAEDCAVDNPAFSDKVQTFIWKQKKLYQNELRDESCE